MKQTRTAETNEMYNKIKSFYSIPFYSCCSTCPSSGTEASHHNFLQPNHHTKPHEAKVEKTEEEKKSKLTPFSFNRAKIMSSSPAFFSSKWLFFIFSSTSFSRFSFSFFLIYIDSQTDAVFLAHIIFPLYTGINMWKTQSHSTNTSSILKCSNQKHASD